VAAVVLAAGRSRRFGSAKLLAPLHGRPLAAHAFDVVSQARASGVVADAVAVVASGDDAVADLALAAGARTIVNDAPDRGLSGSLRRGLAALGADAGAAIILLADQPLVRQEVVAALVGGWRAGLGVVLRPRYAGAPDQPGHPVLLDRSVWALAAALEGDRGLGSLFPPGAAGVALIDVAGRNPDVDTPDDLTTLEGSSS
jgi:CTP:molybdopterin cytidylyltransferase MocA